MTAPEEIAEALSLPVDGGGSLTIDDAGLVTATQEGRFQRYRANLTLMSDLIAYLTEECCAGQTELCPTVNASSICTQC